MARGVRDLLRGSKDVTLAYAARAFANARLRGIGELTELSIDTKARTLHARLALLGEEEPIEVHVRKYRLEQRGENASLTVLDATTSREWLTGVLREFVVGRSFNVPAKAAAALKLLA